MDRKETNKLHRSIIIYAALGIFIIGIIIAAVSLWPLTDYLKQEQKRNLLLAVKTRSLTVEQYISRIKTLATLIPRREDIRDELVEYKRTDEFEKAEIVDFTQQRLSDALKLTPEIEGISRYSVKGTLRIQVGVPVPEEYSPAKLNISDSVYIEGPVSINNRLYLIGVVPAYKDEERIGTDITVFDIERLRSIAKDYTGLGETGETILGVDIKDSVQLFFFLRDTTKKSRVRSYSTPIGQSMRNAFNGETGVVSAKANDERLVLAYAPVPNSDWGIIVKISAEELYGSVIRQMITIIFIILLLIGLGTLGMYLLLRPLSGKLLIHNDELEEQVEEKTYQLNKELKERIKAQEELEKAHNTLEQRVEERTAELAEANQELKDFAYIVSHDLKAPLRAIASIADWLKEDYDEKLDEEGKKNLRLLKDRAMKMQQLIEGILKYSRAGQKQGEREKVDLNNLINEVKEHIRVPENIKVIKDTECPVIFAERIPLFQVFQNLMDNAIKYMEDDNGEIHIGCKEKGDMWEIYVQDTGSGIPKEYLENIFKIFQVVPGKKKKDSTGVGLAIINKIVQKNGGKIWVESEVGKGTTFYFTIPKSEPEG